MYPIRLMDHNVEKIDGSRVSDEVSGIETVEKENIKANFKKEI